jgi:hypothetical protein
MKLLLPACAGGGIGAGVRFPVDVVASALLRLLAVVAGLRASRWGLA